MREDIGRLESGIRHLERKDTPYIADDVVRAYRSHKDEYGFISFARNLARQLGKIGRERIAETYLAAVKNFERFREGRDILLEDMDSDLMMAYESHLKSTEICPQQRLFLYTESTFRIQPGCREGTDGAAQPVQACLYGYRQDRQACRTDKPTFCRSSKITGMTRELNTRARSTASTAI